MSELNALAHTSTADLASEISRKLLNLDPLNAEREVIQLQIKETRDHISTLDARDGLLREHHVYIMGEQQFIGTECERARASIMNEDDPAKLHVKAALTHFLFELRADVDRLKRELDALQELTTRLREEREAVKGTFEEQAMAFLESMSRWVNTLTEVVQTVQSLDEDERVAVRHTLAETKGEDVAKHFWDFCEANPKKDDDSVQP